MRDLALTLISAIFQYIIEKVFPKRSYVFVVLTAIAALALFFYYERDDNGVDKASPVAPVSPPAPIKSVSESQPSGQMFGDNNSAADKAPVVTAILKPTSADSDVFRIGIRPGCIDSKIWQIPSPSSLSRTYPCLERAQQCHFQAVGYGKLLFHRGEAASLPEDCILFRRVTKEFLQHFRFEMQVFNAQERGEKQSYIEIGLVDTRPVHKQDYVRPLTGIRWVWNDAKSSMVFNSNLVEVNIGKELNIGEKPYSLGGVREEEGGLSFHVVQPVDVLSPPFVMSREVYFYIRYHLEPYVSASLSLSLSLTSDK